MPRGIRVLVLYSLVLAISHLVLLFISDTGVFFGITVTGLLVRFLNLGYFVLIMAVVYGFLCRNRRLYYLALVLYLTSILSNSISLFKVNSLELGSYLLPGIALSLAINVITMWYLISIRDYFLLRRKRMRVHENVFVYSIYSVLVIFIVVLGWSVLNFTMRITDTVDDIMDSINTQSFTESLFYCEESTEKDLCYVALVVKNEEDKNINKLCRRIDSRFYQFTCRRAIK